MIRLRNNDYAIYGGYNVKAVIWAIIAARLSVRPLRAVSGHAVKRMAAILMTLSRQVQTGVVVAFCETGFFAGLYRCY